MLFLFVCCFFSSRSSLRCHHDVCFSPVEWRVEVTWFLNGIIYSLHPSSSYSYFLFIQTAMKCKNSCDIKRKNHVNSTTDMIKKSGAGAECPEARQRQQFAEVPSSIRFGIHGSVASRRTGPQTRMDGLRPVYTVTTPILISITEWNDSEWRGRREQEGGSRSRRGAGHQARRLQVRTKETPGFADGCRR